MTRGRFVLLAASWSNAAIASALALHGLRPVWRHGHHLLLADDDLGGVELSGGEGYIVGTLFDRAGREPLGELDRMAEQALAVDGGGDLVRRHWGGYVAVAAGDDDASILRDPSGAVPAYWTAFAGGWVVTSDPATVVATGLLPLAIDWPGVAGHLLFPERRSRRTCLVGWTEVTPGERLTLGGGEPRCKTLWTPWSFVAAEQAIVDADEAAAVVGGAVRHCVGAWHSRYRRPLVSVSGGLDSSVLMASLRAPPQACVTISTDEPGGDERHFARLVADHVGAPLLERSFDRRHVNFRRSNAAGLPRPVSRLFAQELDRIWRDAGVEVGADALFHGGGGDNIFCYLTSPAPVLDSVRLRGPGAATWQTIEDVATLTGVSIGKVITAGVRKAVVDHGRYRWPPSPALLSRAAVRMGETLPHHPWFVDRPRGVLTGKQAHVAALVRIRNHLDAIEPSHRIPVVAPLLSQPIVEACLRVPTWLWCAGGINRAVVRRAFVHDLPQEIVGRRDKGTPGAFGASLIEANRHELLDYLLGGVLAARDMLDLSAVATVLAGDGPLRGLAYLRVSELVDVEAWLQSWGEMAGSGAPRPAPD